MQNNPWITGGIIASIQQCHGLYNLWDKSRKVKCKEGEKDSKGGLVFVSYVLKNVGHMKNTRIIDKH